MVSFLIFKDSFFQGRLEVDVLRIGDTDECKEDISNFFRDMVMIFGGFFNFLSIGMIDLSGEFADFNRARFRERVPVLGIEFLI